MQKKVFSSSIFLFLLIMQVFSQSAIDTVWTGYIDLMGSKMNISVTFKTENNVTGAKIDIPEQQAKELELINVSFSNPKVHFELESPIALAVFDGLFYIDSISGNFEQGSYKGTFSLFRGIGEIKSEEEDLNLPYNSEEVTFTNDGNTFAGTLTYPKTDGRHPAVVLITGSGPQNRNEEIFGFKIFKVIADHLTRSGIAVLRYDDRGVGGTTGKSVNESTTEDFAGDVIAAVQYLKSRDNINPEQIGLFGHSEGGIVAPLSAVKSPADIAFIILMAGTGVNGADIIVKQSTLIMKADKASDEEIENYNKMLKAVFDALKNNASLDDIKKQIKTDIVENFEKIPKKDRKGVTDKEKYASEIAEQTISAFSSAWMKYFLFYDPAPVLSQVKCPVLALFGEKDLQVLPKQNEKPVEDALKKGGNTDYKVIVIPKANHLFQESNTGSPAEYASLPKEFVPGFLETVSDWILQRVTVIK